MKFLDINQYLFDVGDPDIMRLLLHVDINPNVRDIHGKTALIEASSHSNIEIIEMLLEHGFDVNAIDKKYNSALRISIQFKRVDVVKMLLKHGANVDSGILLLAVTFNNERIAEMLFKQYSRSGQHTVNTRDRYSGMALLTAVSKNNTKIVGMILDTGVDVNVRSLAGFTPLGIAIENGNGEIVKMLLEHGASLNIVSKTGRTALSLARKHKNKEIIEILERYY